MPRDFPIHSHDAGRDGCPRVLPWAVAETFRVQAERNHGQTLERLAARGGLSAAETLAAMDGTCFWHLPQELRSGNAARGVLAERLAALST